MRIMTSLICFAALAGGARACEATRRAFDELRPGMETGEVDRLIGCVGEAIAETGEGDGKIVIRKWTGNGEDGSNLTVTFLGEKLIEKAQSKLK